MTLQEFAQELGISEHYLSHHFPQIKESYLRKGYILIKLRRGGRALYGIGKQGDPHIRFEPKK